MYIHIHIRVYIHTHTRISCIGWWQKMQRCASLSTAACRLANKVLKCLLKSPHYTNLNTYTNLNEVLKCLLNSPLCSHFVYPVDSGLYYTSSVPWTLLRIKCTLGHWLLRKRTEAAYARPAARLARMTVREGARFLKSLSSEVLNLNPKP